MYKKVAIGVILANMRIQLDGTKVNNPRNLCNPRKSAIQTVSAIQTTEEIHHPHKNTHLKSYQLETYSKPLITDASCGILS